MSLTNIKGRNIGEGEPENNACTEIIPCVLYWPRFTGGLKASLVCACIVSILIDFIGTINCL